MMFYRVISGIVGLVFLSISIFLFIEDNDNLAKVLLFLTIFLYITVFYIFKSLYYKAEKATFNELFFVLGLPIIPVLLSIVGYVVNLEDILDFESPLIMTVTHFESAELQLSVASLFSIPYYLFALYLLLRTFLRYKFIRYTPYSSGGIPPKLFGIVIAIGIGIFYMLISLFIADLLLLFFGIMYLCTGILSFFA
ncbi:MAG: hypothetical protein INQ03_02225 [Candidatus Heimdallarchaeota archaeon]|nr:hypothetical protein [Candidatus Heimdallarchaeota archaeon]